MWIEPHDLKHRLYQQDSWNKSSSFRKHSTCCASRRNPSETIKSFLLLDLYTNYTWSKFHHRSFIFYIMFDVPYFWRPFVPLQVSLLVFMARCAFSVDMCLWWKRKSIKNVQPSGWEKWFTFWHTWLMNICIIWRTGDNWNLLWQKTQGCWVCLAQRLPAAFWGKQQHFSCF